MVPIEQWGIWKSFNSPIDYFCGLLVLLLFWLMLYWIYNIIRPKCAICNTRIWASQAHSEIIGGHGPETVEFMVICRKHRNH